MSLHCSSLYWERHHVFVSVDSFIIKIYSFMDWVCLWSCAVTSICLFAVVIIIIAEIAALTTPTVILLWIICERRAGEIWDSFHNHLWSDSHIYTIWMTESVFSLHERFDIMVCFYSQIIEEEVRTPREHTWMWSVRWIMLYKNIPLLLL